VRIDVATSGWAASGFRLTLISGALTGTDYFSVPPFDDNGKPPPTDGLPREMNRPPGR